ncbi:MAG: hypothetical protein GY861_14730 [bacterium]|nr:hypothetical protein [bacterium]
MATGRQLITDAMVDTGVVGIDDSIDDSIMQRSLRILNRMLAEWSAEMDLVYASTLDSETWTADAQSMTIGSGGDFDTVRPVSITGFQSRKATLDYTLDQVSYEQYQTTILKSVSTDYPDVFAYQKAYPLGVLYIFPVPTSNLSVRIQSLKPLTALTLNATVALPEGYESAIQSNLAVRLAPAYGTEASPTIHRMAKNSYDALASLNTIDNEMWPDPLLPGFNNGDNIDILTNE